MSFWCCTLNKMRRYARHFNDRRQLKRRSGKRQKCWLQVELIKLSSTLAARKIQGESSSMSERFKEVYRNEKWLYSVYQNENGAILLAVVPSVGWFEIAMRLSDDELSIFGQSKSQFTAFVNKFIKGRDSERFRVRRIDVKTEKENNVWVLYTQ